MIASALQLLGIAAVVAALAVWAPLVGLIAFGIAMFVLGFIMEAR